MKSNKIDPINDTNDYNKIKNVNNRKKHPIMFIICLLSPLIIIFLILFVSYKIRYSKNKCELKYKISSNKGGWSNYYNNCQNATNKNEDMDGIIIILICPFERDISKSLFYRYGNDVFVQNGEISKISKTYYSSKYDFEISSKLKIDIKYSFYNGNMWSNFTQKGKVLVSYNQFKGINICLA